MAVPKFDELFEPFLAALNDNNEHSASEMKELVSRRINISNEDRNETIPSGKQTRFDSNIGWAKTYLEKAGLIQTAKRGVYKITPLGQEALSSYKPLTIEYLQQFESFQEFQTIKSSPRENYQEGKVTNNTPDKDLESAYEAIQKRLEEDLYEKILELEPYRFEHLVLKLLAEMGYGVETNWSSWITKLSNDKGIDGEIPEDKLGFSYIYVQAKRWAQDHTVGRPEIQKFVGALEGKQAQKGLFITTSSFSNEAQNYAAKLPNKKVVLKDGNDLVRLMIQHNVGVQLKDKYEIKKVDEDFFEPF